MRPINISREEIICIFRGGKFLNLNTVFILVDRVTSLQSYIYYTCAYIYNISIISNSAPSDHCAWKSAVKGVFPFMYELHVWSKQRQHDHREKCITMLNDNHPSESIIYQWKSKQLSTHTKSINQNILGLLRILDIHDFISDMVLLRAKKQSSILKSCQLMSIPQKRQFLDNFRVIYI